MLISVLLRGRMGYELIPSYAHSSLDRFADVLHLYGGQPPGVLFLLLGLSGWDPRSDSIETMCQACGNPSHSSAPFREDLAEWAKSFYEQDGLITFYVDKRGTLGDEPVTRKEFRHVKRQVRIVEAELDEITGNAFKTRFVKNPAYADVEVFHMDDISKKGFGDAAGMWSLGQYARNGRGELVFDRDVDFGRGRAPYSGDRIKEILSHELGHMFGLGHTEGGKDLNSLMNSSLQGDNQWLTDGDLGVMTSGWASL